MTDSPESKILQLIAEQLGRDAQDIGFDDNICEKHGADSLDVIEIIMAVEDEFNVSIPDADDEKFTSVRSIANHLKGLKTND